MKTVVVPFLNLQAINARQQNALGEAAARVVASGRYILGEETAAFEEAFAKFCRVPHCVGVGSGLDALILMLRAAVINGKLREGDEIIVPANTYIATVLAIQYAGLIPVLAEPDPETFNISNENLAPLVTPRTRAVMAVHLYGLAAPMARLNAFCRAHDLLLFSDAAQAHGAQTEGASIAALGEAAAFSFYPSKNLGALGDGGAVVASDAQLAETVRILRNYGSPRKNETVLSGVNSRLSELQAALLREKLPLLDEDNRRRRQIAARYCRDIRHPQIILPTSPPEAAAHVWHLFVARCRRRDDLQKHLAASGVETIVHYPIPPHLQVVYRGAPMARLSLPITETMAREVLSLPISPVMQEDEIDKVIAAVNSFDKK